MAKSKPSNVSFRECCFKSAPEDGRRLIWEVTHECKTNCDYCFQEKKRRSNRIRVMNETDLKKISSGLVGLNVRDVLITGGEIYEVRDVVPQLAQSIKELGVPMSFSSNHLMDEDFLKLLLSFQPRAFNISLDPPNQEGSRLYLALVPQVTELLRLCEERGVAVKITCVLTSKNVLHLDKLLATLSELVGTYSCLSSVYVTNPYEIGYLKQGIRPSGKSLSEAIAQASKYGADYLSLVNFHQYNMPLQRCLAGLKYVHVEPNGNVFPCHLFANLNPEVFMMGNILADGSPDISTKLELFAKQAQEAVTEYKAENETCSRCQSQSTCGGGCLAEIISAGNLIEPQLICRDLQPSKRAHKSSAQQMRLSLGRTAPDLTREEEEKIIEHVRASLRRRHHDLAHGFDHVQCVVRIARHIAMEEKANLRVVTAAAYFHDYAPRQKLLFETHTRVSAEKAVRFLRSIGFGDELDEIYQCIDTSSYGSAELGHEPLSLEAKIVRDADWLDAIGARGIARVFAFGAAHGCETLGECEWDPEQPPKKRMSLIGPDPSPIYHFFSKLLWVKDAMQTESGKRLAAERHQRLIEFLNNYRDEMTVGLG